MRDVVGAVAVHAPRWIRRVAVRLRPEVTKARDDERPALDERPAPEDEVDEAGLESFPASDPPPWTLGVVATPRRS